MKRKAKKLALNRETVRTLQDSELGQVAGGIAVRRWHVTVSCTCGFPMREPELFPPPPPGPTP